MLDFILVVLDRCVTVGIELSVNNRRLVGLGLALVVLHLYLLLKLSHRLLRLGLECLVSLAFGGGVIQCLLGLLD